MVNKNIQFDFDDLLIQPAEVSDIETRKNINIFDENGFLKIFTAPMFDVVNDENYKSYLDNKIYTILPRKKTEDYTEEYILTSNVNKFISVGLDEFKKYFIDENTKLKISKKVYILIDIANGHMRLLLNYIKESKLFYKDNLILMVGNIANPKTYFNLSAVGADFIRVGIGFGSACTTAKNTSISYSIASLLDDINIEKKIISNVFSNVKFAKIIADGGLKNFSDIIKSFALGADYIMLGGIFNKSFESSGDFYVNIDNEFIKLDNKLDAKLIFDDKKLELYKEYRGMSTKLIQKELGREKLKTSEGIRKYNKVEYYLDSWVENFSDYLKSCLSYTDRESIKDFIGNVTLNLISAAAYNRYNK